jgi:SpoVK/Ycf46/Vps4 family AAA+-type ATPase
VLEDRVCEYSRKSALLSESHTIILQTIAARARQSSAQRILFAGGSEKQKKGAVQVLAKELNRKTYRVSLHAVVGKYIGETEKNLLRVFDNARETDSILFFDEADALFGKRSQLRDSHDRFANLETNYLLRQIENYNGIAILATSRKEPIPKASLRRFSSIVDFC